MSELNREDYRRKIGTGGAREPCQVVTGGQTRFEFDATQPGLRGQPATATPTTPTVTGGGVFFFRDRGDGKAQLCVLFPSGATQVIATEP